MNEARDGKALPPQRGALRAAPPGGIDRIESGGLAKAFPNAKANVVKRFSILSLPATAVTLMAVWLAAGCTSNTTNLTPRTGPAQPDSIYSFEVQWESPRRGSTAAKSAAYVMVGSRLFPMSLVPNSQNRWEAAVPLPQGETYVPYKYKFDFWYPGLGRGVLTNSEWSPEYRLVVPAR